MIKSPFKKYRDGNILTADEICVLRNPEDAYEMGLAHGKAHIKRLAKRYRKAGLTRSTLRRDK